MDMEVSLKANDYVVIALILCVSLGIGVLFAVKDFRNVNRFEYLLGGRRMSMLPVALSIFATFSSGITLLGVTTDVYVNGVMASMLFLGIGFGFVWTSLTLVPLMYPLSLTSLYEYLQLRFDSRAVRIFAVTIGMFQTLCYMSIALLSPAIALQTGAGLPLWMSIGVLGFIGTLYTAIGGIKSVVWSDAFQSVVMFGGLLTIIIKGNALVGGGESAWNIAEEGGRTSFKAFSLDPRVRHTWWGNTFGSFFFSLALISNQSSLQRISASKTMKTAKRAFFLSGVILPVYGIAMAAMAWVMYAYYATIRCDPFEAGIISNKNQLPPLYVMQTMKDVPGLCGIYLATIFSASLSTLSSGINALATNTVEDFLKKPLHNVQESTATYVTKVLVCVYGLLIIGLAYCASSLQGQIIKMTISIVGALGGPMFGIFLLGALFPWTNSYGAIGGGVTTLLFNMYIVIGNNIYGSKSNILPSPPSDMCFFNISKSDHDMHNGSMLLLTNDKLSTLLVRSSESNNTKLSYTEVGSFCSFLYDISYEWYSFIGTALSLVIGIFISYGFRRHCPDICEDKFLFPFVRRLWLPKRSQNDLDKNSDENNRMHNFCEISLKENIPHNSPSNRRLVTE